MEAFQRDNSCIAPNFCIFSQNSFCSPKYLLSRIVLSLKKRQMFHLEQKATNLDQAPPNLKIQFRWPQNMHIPQNKTVLKHGTQNVRPRTHTDAKKQSSKNSEKVLNSNPGFLN